MYSNLRCVFRVYFSLLQVRETRKTEADSRSGKKKMAIGHHIGMYGEGKLDCSDGFLMVSQVIAHTL